MVMSVITVSGIKPNVSVLGDTQSFIFTPNDGFFGVQSLFVPTPTVPSRLNWEFKNSGLGGYRWTHVTDSTGGAGIFKLSSFLNGSVTGTDILTLSPTGTSFNLPASFPAPILPTDAANKSYVDGKTWTTNQITDFNTAVRAYHLSDFLTPLADISLGNFKITNLAPPLNNNDAATKGYIDGKTWTVSQITNFDSSVRAYHLSDLLAALSDISVNNFKLVNLGSPANASDAATKGYVDTKSWSSGQISNLDATIRSYHLSDFLSPLADLSMNSHKLTALSSPTLSTDAATKGYVDTAIGGVSTTLTLQGDVSGSGQTSSPIATTINKPLNQMPVPVGAMNFNGQLLQSVASPITGTDGANKTFVQQEANIAGAAGQLTVSGNNPKNIGLVATGVIAGSYTNMNATVDLYGRVTLASNGTGGGGGSGDTFQTLPSSPNVVWDFSAGNIATITLTSNTALTLVVGTASKGVLIVKQDGTGNRTLSLPAGVFRQGSTSQFIPLSTAANSIDVLNFQRDVNNNLYIWNAAYQFIAIGATPTNKYTFIYDGTIKTLAIPVSANNVCRIKVLAGGGGQGVYSAQGNSGAAGYTVFHFSTTNYIGQEIKLIVGQGGEGGNSSSIGFRSGYGGYPDGGNGSWWSSGIGGEYCGGGGGRSDVRIGLTTQSFGQATIVAIAGAGGGGSGYSSLYGGAGGGSSGQNTIGGSLATGGTQSTGGTSAATPPSGFIQAAQFQGAGFTAPQESDSYTGGGGGGGYYGGGFYAGFVGGGGGSGFLNTSFSGYLSSYASISSATYQGNGMAIPTQASSDSDFSGGYGIGYVGMQNGEGKIGSRGGNGKIIVEFL